MVHSSKSTQKTACSTAHLGAVSKTCHFCLIICEWRVNSVTKQGGKASVKHTGVVRHMRLCFQFKLVVLSVLIGTQKYIIVFIYYICAQVNQNVCHQNVNKSLNKKHPRVIKVTAVTPADNYSAALRAHKAAVVLY